MKKILIISLLIALQYTAFAENYKLTSPDELLKLQVSAEDGKLFYELTKGSEVLILKSELGLETDLFSTADFTDFSVGRSEGVDEFRPYWGTYDELKESYNQLTLKLSEEFALQFRVYNRGMAWRYMSRLEKGFVVKDEQANFKLSSGSTVYFPEAEGFSTPFEANFIPRKTSELQNKLFGTTPLLVKTNEGTVMVISEVNLHDYAGMFMNLDKEGLSAVFPPFPKKEKEQFLGRLRLTNIPQLSKKLVKKEEDFIAKSSGKQDFPWRAILVDSEEINLLSNNLVAALADKTWEEEDYSWVKPGKVVWDWYHKWNLQGVDFKPGINTETYKYMIDFAAKNKLQYVNIDDGWCGLHNFRKINKNLDLEEVMAYAKSKDIGIFLWCTWQTLEKDLDGNLDYFKGLGAAGLKVDFFDRTDQVVVDFVNELAIKSADRKLLLNLHGMYKPTGLQITYPNMVNFEGILGLEYNKFSDKCTPEHNATVAFTRNVVGPMDYTPGGMRYVSEEDFEKSWANPHVMTTKAQQMAMYVVYHGGVQMLADSPTFYEKDEKALNFLKEVPVTWDEVVPLEGKIGEYVVLARRKGNDWYIAGLNGGDEMTVSFKTDFLAAGNYNMVLLCDGESAEELKKIENTISIGDSIPSKTISTDNQQDSKQKTAKNTLEVTMKKAGGFVMVLSEK